MNEQLQNALSSILLSAVDAVGKAKDFLVAELPDVIYQLLLWKGVYSFTLFVLAMSVAIIWTISMFPLWKAAFREAEATGDDSLVTAGVITGVTGVLGFLFFLFTFNLTWLQIWLAPKVYLIEYAASLVKK